MSFTELTSMWLKVYNIERGSAKQAVQGVYKLPGGLKTADESAICNYWMNACVL